MVNLGAATHQFVLLSNRNSARASALFMMIYSLIGFSLTSVASYFLWGLLISIFPVFMVCNEFCIVRDICLWTILLSTFQKWLDGVSAIYSRFGNFFLETLFSKQQNIVKTQQFEWCSSFKLKWKAWAFEQLFWWWQKKLCGTPFWRD